MKAWKSGAWTVSGQIVSVIVKTGTLAILGRLLTPEQFGVFGLVLVIQSLVQPILDLGLLPVYLKLEKVTEEASNVFFTANILVGSLISILVIILAPWISLYYKINELKYLLILFSISIVFSAAKGQPQAVLSRNRRFDQIIKVQTGVMLAGSVLVLTLAYQGFEVWSLVWRAIFEAVVGCCVLFIISDRKYAFANVGIIKSYYCDLKFGLNIVLTRLLLGWVEAIDKLILGKLGTLDMLGGYSRAQQFAQMPDVNIRAALTTPALVYLSQSNDKIKNFLLLSWIVFLIAGTPCLFLIVYGDILFPILMGPQWAELGWMLQWLGLLGLAKVFQGLSVIYNIDQKQVGRTIKYLMVSALGVFTIPILLFLFTKNVHNFVVSLAVMGVAYWSCVLLHTMAIDYFEYLREIMKFGAILFTISIISIISTMLVRQIQQELDVVMIVVIGALLHIILPLIMFVLLDCSSAMRMFRMMKVKK